MKVRQVLLSQKTRRLQCWVEDRPGVKAGYSLTLKGETGRWAIDSVGNLRLDSSQLNTRWNVGGLF